VFCGGFVRSYYNQLLAMITTYIVVVVCGALAGWLAKITFDAISSELHISQKEYVWGVVLIIFVTAGVIYGTSHYLIEDKITYKEWWNGWELRAVQVTTTCTRDGACRNTYACDPYIVMVQSCTSDGDGMTSCTSVPQTRYHYCPYTTKEWSFYIDTTLGRFTIDEHRFPTHPEEYRWRDTDRSFPGSVGRGVPDFWQEAKDRIESGNPGPVTKRMEYINFILPSDHTILKQYASDIEAYKSAGLLPQITHTVVPIADVRESYIAHKVYFVKVQPQQRQQWYDAIGKLNAGFGNELHGDVHLVIASSSAIENIDGYLFALKAYWQHADAFGKDALSKNAVLIVVTVQDGVIDRVRATTGMPLGNEDMTTALESHLVGLPLDPNMVIGSTTGTIKGSTVISEHGTGVIESVLWGLKDSSTRFERVCMECVEEGGVGFGYLKNEIRLTAKELIITALVAFGASLSIWVIFAFVGDRHPYPWRRRYY
jgi:hypothetical protein